jgi:hypothetical protein
MVGVNLSRGLSALARFAMFSLLLIFLDVRGLFKNKKCEAVGCFASKSITPPQSKIILFGTIETCTEKRRT